MPSPPPHLVNTTRATRTQQNKPEANTGLYALENNNMGVVWFEKRGRGAGRWEVLRPIWILDAALVPPNDYLPAPFFFKKIFVGVDKFFSIEEHLLRIWGNLVHAGFLGFWKGAPPLESGNSDVILVRQSCNQRSGIMMAAASERRALQFDFTVRMWYMFLMSKWRGSFENTEKQVSVSSRYLQKERNCTVPISEKICGHILFWSQVGTTEPNSFWKYRESAPT